MSYFQPLITSAFSNYSINRNIYADRVSVQDHSIDHRKTESNQNNTKVYDSDFGKPQSASGDILDLSQDVQKQYKVAETNDNSSNKIGVNNHEEENEVNNSDDATTNQTHEDSLETAEKTSTKNGLSATELTPEEQQQVQELKARDQEVRIHEAAHVAAGGPYVTGGPTYTYQTGPDGKSYAIGGEVGIDTSEVNGDPEATIRKMQTVVAAALAPAEPSGQDQKVAAVARQKEAQARAELAKQNYSDLNGNQETKNPTSSPLATSESKSSSSSATTNQSDSNQSKESGKTDTESGLFSAVKSSVVGLTKSTSQSSAYQAQTSSAISPSHFSVFA